MKGKVHCLQYEGRGRQLPLIPAVAQSKVASITTTLSPRNNIYMVQNCFTNYVVITSIIGVWIMFMGIKVRKSELMTEQSLGSTQRRAG